MATLQRKATLRRDLLLVCLTVGSGAVDAISYFGLGQVFTANMTGNIVLLGLAAGQSAGGGVLRSGVSLAAFGTGVFAASRLVIGSEESGIWHRRVTAALAFEAVAQVGLLAGWLATSGRPAPSSEAVLVGFSALAMGIQSAAVSALGVSGVSTTYVTGMLTGLVGEMGSRSERARRGAILAALLVGAACGGLLLVSARRIAPVLPLAMTLIVVTTAMSSRSDERRKP